MTQYRCPDCEKSYTRAYDLIRHKRLKHENDHDDSEITSNDSVSQVSKVPSNDTITSKKVSQVSNTTVTVKDIFGDSQTEETELWHTLRNGVVREYTNEIEQEIKRMIIEKKITKRKVKEIVLVTGLILTLQFHTEVLYARTR